MPQLFQMQLLGEKTLENHGKQPQLFQLRFLGEKTPEIYWKQQQGPAL